MLASSPFEGELVDAVVTHVSPSGVIASAGAFDLAFSAEAGDLPEGAAWDATDSAFAFDEATGRLPIARASRVRARVVSVPDASKHGGVRCVASMRGVRRVDARTVHREGEDCDYYGVTVEF